MSEVDNTSTLSSLPKLLLQVTLHNIKLQISSKIALETTLILVVDGSERHQSKCSSVYTNQDTRVAPIENMLRIKVDDKAAKRKLIVKVNATKNGQQKLVAMHTMELLSKTQALQRFTFDKCIDKEGYMELSFKMLSVKGLKS